MYMELLLVVVFGDAEVPLEQQVLALGVAGHPLPVAAELRVVRRQQHEPGLGPLAELLDDVAVAEVRLDLPVRRDRAEVHHADVAPRRFGRGFDALRVTGP